MVVLVNYQIDSTPLSSIIANLNSFATLPTTSKGAGEIIHYSGDNTVRWNSQTTDPTTNPIWSDLSAGGVTDHGALTGLADDDHTQYYNSDRHTKAVHDALNIDADTLDGKNAIDFLWLDGSLTMAGNFKLNADLILYDTIIRDCGGLYAPDNLDLNIGINNGVGIYDTKVAIDDNGLKLFDELNVNTHPLTDVANIYSEDDVASYTRFYNVNAGNTLKFEIDKNYNTSYQILDMNNNDIIHCYSLGGRLDAELVIESKYQALGLTAVAGYDVDVFRRLDLNGNDIANAAIPGTNNTTFTIDQDNAGAGVNTALKFNRGLTDGDARILWNETDDRFDIEGDAGVTLAEVRTKQLDVQDQVNLDDTVGTVMIKKNDSTGDMEFQVAAGDSFVFKTV